MTTAFERDFFVQFGHMLLLAAVSEFNTWNVESNDVDHFHMQRKSVFLSIMQRKTQDGNWMLLTCD